MHYRLLGSTKVQVSAIAFGAGPVPAVMTSGDQDRQTALVEFAIATGINWFDTAATYGMGLSESHLGEALAALNAHNRVHVATKVRLTDDDLRGTRILDAVRRSLDGSLTRLQLPRVTLLQLHNSVTHARGQLPTSLAVDDVLGRGGVVDALERLRTDGLVDYIGFTGLGDADSLHKLVRSGRFQTIQIPLSLVNPTGSRKAPVTFSEHNFGQIIPHCAQQGMGVFAIRVYAAGALGQLPPSEHTKKTPFFPLDLYERDVERARCMARLLDHECTAMEAGLRFSLYEPGVSAAIIGFSQLEHIRQAIEWYSHGSLAAELTEQLLECTYAPFEAGGKP